MLVALHLWVVFSNVILFAGWVIHDYRFSSWHPFPLAGFGFFLAGAALILWAIAHLRWAAFVPSAERPLIRGPYAWVRHPVYAEGKGRFLPSKKPVTGRGKRLELEG